MIRKIFSYFKPPFLGGMPAFLTIWFGQLVSLIGSELSGFALGIWVYQRHQAVTEFALISLTNLIPELLFAPLAGTLSDRWNRRWVMIMSDTGAAVSTLGIALLLFMGRLEVWHIYMATAISSAFRAFQRPAYIAATTMLVPAQSLGRVSGLVQLGEASAQLLSPPLGGILLGIIQLQGIFVIDFITFFFALFTLFLIRIPAPQHREITADSKRTSLVGEMLEGLYYIINRPGLWLLLIFSTSDNFLVGFVGVLVTPFALSFTTPFILGVVMSIGGLGMIVGSLVMVTWSSIRRYIDGVLIFNFLSGLAIFLVGWHSSISLLTLSTFLFFFSVPIISGCEQVIWQKKVALEIQGRVFALQQMLSIMALTIAYPISAILADKVFEPLMSSNGLLAKNIGLILGTGQGRGIGLMFVVVGFMSLIVTTIASLNPYIRYVETNLPDQV